MSIKTFCHILKKSSMICLLLCLWTTAAQAADQSTSITLKVENVTLKDALKNIEKSAGYIFLYNEKTIDLNRRVSADLKNVTIDKILQTVLDPHTKYEVTARQVVLYKHRKSEVELPKAAPPEN